MPATKIHGSMIDGASGSVTAAKTTLGLENVTNTSDANKPVSAAQQTALNLKSNIASPSFTGRMSGTHTLEWGANRQTTETDWNNVIQGGFYMKSSMTNAPRDAATWFYVLVQRHTDTYTSQMAWDLSSGLNAVYHRFRSGGSWQAWQELWHSGNVATVAQFRAGTVANGLNVANVWSAAELAVLTDAATIVVNFANGFNFGGASNAVLALGDNRTLGAPSNVKGGQSGVLWFGATGGTRTLTLNAAWLLMDGVESGPYSITTSQILGVAYVTRSTVTYVTAILRRAA